MFIPRSSFTRSHDPSQHGVAAGRLGRRVTLNVSEKASDEAEPPPGAVVTPYEQIDRKHLPFTPPSGRALCWKLVSQTASYWFMMLAVCSFALLTLWTDEAQLRIHHMLDSLNSGIPGKDLSTALTAYVIFFPVINFFIYLWMLFENVCRERFYYRATRPPPKGAVAAIGAVGSKCETRPVARVVPLVP